MMWRNLEKKKIFGPEVFDFFGQIIFRSTFYTHLVCVERYTIALTDTIHDTR